ncbi:MAG: cupin domain-containing protein [Deltaproteobacteria bacterium]|nr:cupin domain-containing protein [Deltaproteobacteria bacterium]
MTVIHREEAPVFELPHAPGVVFTGLASPKRGSKEVSAWRVTLAPHTPGTPHSVTREEIFVVVRGEAAVTIGETTHHVKAGGAVVVPALTTFSLANDGDVELEAVVVFPVGGQAVLPTGATFTPPWAE